MTTESEPAISASEKVTTGLPTPSEGDPAGVAGSLAAPAGHQHQHAGDGEREHAQQDEEERGDPLGGQLRRDAVAVPAVDGLALLDQAHRQRAWRETQEGWLEGGGGCGTGAGEVTRRWHAGATPDDVTPLPHLAKHSYAKKSAFALLHVLKSLHSAEISGI